MYSTAENVRIVIALLKEHGINQIVLSPGGTNAPFIRGVQDDPFFTCYSVVDERSALYFAIGIYLANGRPVAMCCTSAQATRNYIPGLTEAYYKHVPILAITFSKHPQYVGQDYMQAPNQTSLPVDAVRKSFPLPYVSTVHDRLHCERLVNEAILELTHIVPAPVQLNVPMLDNELGMFDAQELPCVKVIRRYSIASAGLPSLKGKKILIVVGENRGNLVDAGLIETFASTHNAAIYVNQLSNLRTPHTVAANRLLLWSSQDDFDTRLCPDVLISIGGQTGDYPFYHKLSKTKCPYEHWRISPGGEVVDTYDHLTTIFECEPDEFFRAYASGERDETYLLSWRHSLNAHDLTLELPLSNAYLAQTLHDQIPAGSYVDFAILNSLRVWNLFPLKNECKCFSTVAAFGIDGCLSSFLGQSTQTDSLCFLVIGDLSFFYDMNALGIRHLGKNVRVLLVNNAGGMEFKYGASAVSRSKIDQYIAAGGHFKNAEGWAKTCGFEYLPIHEKCELAPLVKKLISTSDQPILVEVFVTDEDEDKAFGILRAVNSPDTRSFAERVAGRIKREIKKIV